MLLTVLFDISDLDSEDENSCFPKSKINSNGKLNFLPVLNLLINYHDYYYTNTEVPMILI